MRRVFNVYGAGDTRIDSVPLPEVGPKDILVDIKACGICGSDLNYINLGLLNLRNRGSPVPLGHESADVIREVGNEVEGIQPGMKVIINSNRTITSDQNMDTV